MNISGFQKLTLLDYPNNLACIIFTQGCNFKCPFCHNSPLISNNEHEDSFINEEEILKYLDKRKSILDGVVISGGEPTTQKNLKPFIQKIKEKGLKVKLDTNGSNTKILKELIDNSLIDYVAMDIKNDKDNYSNTCGLNKVNINNIKESIEILKSSNIDYEFRTTIIKEYHNIEFIKNILKLIGDNSKYYLQNFVDSENVIDKSIHGFSDEELRGIYLELNKEYKNVKIRGLYSETIGGNVYV